MNVEVRTAKDWNIPGFEEFYDSLLAVASKNSNGHESFCKTIITSSELALRYTCAGLIYCDRGELFSPIVDFEEIFSRFVPTVFDEKGDFVATGKHEEILIKCGVIMLSLRNIMYELNRPDNIPDISIIHLHGLYMGSAYTHIQLQMHGLSKLIDLAGPAMESAKQIAAVRSKGGKKRAEELRSNAAAWKAEALKVAEKFDAKHPNWTRSKMAAEIVQHYDWTEPGSRQIEIWLKDEAEQPNGPLKSRARNKGARTQVS